MGCGSTVGLRVGVVVGDGLGVSVGLRVGVVVGDRLGVSVGLRVGVEVAVGIGVSVAVGVGVGPTNTAAIKDRPGFIVNNVKSRTTIIKMINPMIPLTRGDECLINSIIVSNSY